MIRPSSLFGTVRVREVSRMARTTIRKGSLRRRIPDLLGEGGRSRSARIRRARPWFKATHITVSEAGSAMQLISRRTAKLTDRYPAAIPSSCNSRACSGRSCTHSCVSVPPRVSKQNFTLTTTTPRRSTRDSNRCPTHSRRYGRSCRCEGALAASILPRP